MSRDRRNIARIGRGIAGMTQERWAEALGYSVRTVAAWELGEQQISSEAVVRMVDVTGQQVRFIPTCVGLMINWKVRLKNKSGSSPRAWG